jgi:glycosyltransferase involved in cell wall biosynthesis
MFSLIMPTYNYGHEIRGAIRSVFAQEYPDWELIVITDGCTDDTVPVVRAFSDRRVRLLVEERHSGSPGYLRNRGIDTARGDIICYLDQDDRWSPDHLSRLAVVYQDPAVRVVATGCERIDGDDRVLSATGPLNMAWHPELQIVSPIFEPSRVSHRRGAIDRVDGWTTDPAGLEDWDLWVRWADAGEAFTLVADRSVQCRLHPTSRRHGLGHRYLHTFGPAMDAATATRVLTVARQPEVRGELGRRFRADVVAWYKALAATGRLRLAADLTIEKLVTALERDLGDPPFAPHVRRVGDRFVLCRVLACGGQAHAERIVALNRRRMTRSSAYLADLMDRAAA